MTSTVAYVCIIDLYVCCNIVHKSYNSIPVNSVLEYIVTVFLLFFLCSEDYNIVVVLGLV